MSKTAGIEARHADDCPKRNGGRGRCKTACRFRAQVYVPEPGGKPRREKSRWGTLDEAKSWRVNRLNEIAHGVRRTPTTVTLRDAWQTWLGKAETGAVLNRSRERYQPRTLRDYKADIAPVLDKHGNLPLSKITHEGLQRLIDKMQADGVSAARINNTVTPIRALFRDSRLIVPGGIQPNPTTGLRLPKRPKSEHPRVEVKTIFAMLDALPDSEKPLWATLFFAGLRISEARALQWQHVDFAANLIHVRRKWDRVEGPWDDTKSRAGQRNVPMPQALSGYLKALRQSKPDAADDDLVFGRADGRPFNESTIAGRADRAWKNAGIERMTRHAARHAYAALMIPTASSIKAVSDYLGHASIRITADTYGSLIKGTEAQDAAALDRLLGS